MEHRE
jgi:hypothetical protein